MKKTVKGMIGKVLKSASLHPVGRASLNQEGHACVPLEMLNIVKNLEKHEDITKYPEFGPLATEVIKEGSTCLYYDRLYTIYQALYNALNQMDVLTTAEVGVYKGGTSKFIASVLESNYDHYCFDTFEGHDAKDIREVDSHKASQFNDTQFEDVRKLLEKYPNVHIYKGRFEDMCGVVDKKTFDFVHLDVDIYAPTLHALHFFHSRLSKNGIIVVDDYGHRSCPGVRQAVDEFSQRKEGCGYMKFHLLTGQMLMVKVI